MLKNLKAILFDLDNTLYHYEPANEQAKRVVFKFLAKKLGRPEAEIKKHFTAARANTNRRLATQGSSHSRLLYLQGAFESITGRTNIQLTLQAEKIFWDAFLKSMRPRTGMLELIKFLKQSGIKIGVLTNLTAHIQMQKLVQLKLDHLIDFLITSEEAGVEKPAKQIFAYTLRKLHLHPSQVAMVGDDWEPDALGAKHAGMIPIFIDFKNQFGNKKIKSVIIVKNLDEIKKLLG